MPDSWPRCFAAAWRGLDDAQRAKLDEAWAQPRLQPGLLHIDEALQFEVPIWTVAYRSGASATLIGLKLDFPPEVPSPDGKPA